MNRPRNGVEAVVADVPHAPHRPRFAMRVPVAALAALLLLAGCFAPGGGDQPGPAGPPLLTPQASLSAQVDGTVSLVRAALARANLQLDTPVVPYRPSEPAGLATAPRAILQVTLPGAGAMDPDQGYVMVYDLASTATATDRGQELATYLGSGFGQTNYPLDAQFAIAQVGGTLVFTWWSASRAADDSLAQSAFDAIASVGQPIPVTK